MEMTASKRSSEVAEMFGRISRRYDLANTVLSLGVHHLWRRRLVRSIQQSATSAVLDLCTGTGDLLAPLRKRSGYVVGADFSFGMLKVGRERSKIGSSYELVQGTALSLPFADESFDAVTVAFGVRNFENLEVGLKEIRRILKLGGKILILEFGQPRGRLFGPFYRWYSAHVIPLLGGLITGQREPYLYLLKTSAEFPCGKDFNSILERCGFLPEISVPLTFGIAFRYVARKA